MKLMFIQGRTYSQTRWSVSNLCFKIDTLTSIIHHVQNLSSIVSRKSLSSRKYSMRSLQSSRIALPLSEILPSSAVLCVDLPPLMLYQRSVQAVARDRDQGSGRIQESLGGSGCISENRYCEDGMRPKLMAWQNAMTDLMKQIKDVISVRAAAILKAEDEYKISCESLTAFCGLQADSARYASREARSGN
jgi:hypothetical protein